MEAILLYIDDWNSSKKIEMMDAAEERGYLRLLMRAAKEPDCGLPDDDAQLAIISKLGSQWNRPTRVRDFRVKSSNNSEQNSSRNFAKTSGQKLRECFFSRGGRIYNERLLKEHAKYLSNLEQKRSAARKRWGKQEAEQHADAMRAHMRTDMRADMRQPMREGCGDPCGGDAATIQTYKPTNINTPLPPLSEGDGADAPLVLVSPDSVSKEKPQKPVPARKPYAETLKRVAQCIYEGHPTAFDRRDLGIEGVEKKLEAILRYRRTPVADCAGYLERIGRNHMGACESEKWSKNGGEFAPGLRNWLAPREGRYDVAPSERRSTIREIA